MFRNHPARILALAGLVVAVAVAVPVTAAAKPKAPAKPTITKFTPTSAKPGEKITIDGKPFVHVTAVKIDNLSAKHTVDSQSRGDFSWLPGAEGREDRQSRGDDEGGDGVERPPPEGRLT